MQRKCQNWLTLFVVLPQIGKKKLQTNERMRKTAIKNRNKKTKSSELAFAALRLVPSPRYFAKPIFLTTEERESPQCKSYPE